MLNLLQKEKWAKSMHRYQQDNRIAPDSSGVNQETTWDHQIIFAGGYYFIQAANEVDGLFCREINFRGRLLLWRKKKRMILEWKLHREWNGRKMIIHLVGTVVYWSILYLSLWKIYRIVVSIWFWTLQTRLRTLMTSKEIKIVVSGEANRLHSPVPTLKAVAIECLRVRHCN